MHNAANSLKKELVNEASHVKFNSLKETHDFLTSQGFKVHSAADAQVKKDKKLSYSVEEMGSKNIIHVEVHPTGMGADVAKKLGAQAYCVPANKACLAITTNIPGTPLQTTEVFPFQSHQLHEPLVGHELAHVVQQRQGRVQPSSSL